jgi:hypothetical protein
VGQYLAAGNVAANAPVATDREPTTDELAAPGLLETIRAYLDGMARFNAAPNFTTDDETEAFAAKTYEPHWGALKAWSGPAATWEEAIEAMRLADKALQDGDDDLAASLVRAARLFFDHAPEKQDAPHIVTKQQVWDLGEAASQVDSALSVVLQSLDSLGDQLIGNPLMKDANHLQNVIRLVIGRSSFLVEQLHEMDWRFNENANGAASGGQ